jgi:hypothetical protein
VNFLIENREVRADCAPIDITAGQVVHGSNLRRVLLHASAFLFVAVAGVP